MLIDEVPQSHVPSLDVRSWRRLIECRRHEIDKRTRVKNGLRSLLRSYGIVTPSKPGLWTQKGRVWLREVQWPTSLAALERDLLMDQLEHADRIVARITYELDKLARQHPAVALLRSIPGVGPRTAEVIVAYIDDHKRFARINRVGAYFGVIPSQDASAGVNRLGHITKEGPATARKLIVEAAWQVIRHDDSMRAYFDRIVAGKKERRKIALVAVAHKLLRCMLAMLRSGEVWQPGLSTAAIADEVDGVADDRGSGDPAVTTPISGDPNARR